MNPRHHSSSGATSARGQKSGGSSEPGSAGCPAAVEAEAWVLATETGRHLLEEIRNARPLGPALVNRLRKEASPEAVRAAIRLSEARRKAAMKFEQGSRMWVDLIGVEQATAEPVANHKAGRFRCDLVVDLCAGIGSDTLALAARSNVLAVDRDQGMCRRILYNARLIDVSARVLPIRAQAERFAIPADAWLHLDPDRRATSSRRASRLADYSPGPPFWNSLIERVAAGAIKLSPAADFSKHFASSNVEIELISLRGECKEATVWFGELVSCRRRATRLPENVTWTDQDGRSKQAVTVAPLSRIIYDPDPSLPRAGLLDGFAHEHGLCRIVDGVDYLTGEHLVTSPFLAPFRVREVSPLDLKLLTRLIVKHEIGTLEIKVRGVDITPESLRAKLKPRGTAGATLLLIGGSGAVRAVLAQRVSTGGLGASSPAGGLVMRSPTTELTTSPLPSARPPEGAAGSSGPIDPTPFPTT